MEKRYSIGFERNLEEDSDRDSEEHHNNLIILGDAIELLNDFDLDNIDSIVIETWSEPYDDNCQNIIDIFVNNKDKFKNLDSLFIGDMDYMQCEVSWIQQGNYSKIFEALPNLKKLIIKGSVGLTLGKNIENKNLKHLEIICGGLPSNIISELLQSKLPNLETLILYVGVEFYGFNDSIDNLIMLADKNLFPNLKRLGFVDSEKQNEIAEKLLKSNILPQLEELDLCYGCFTDKGATILLNNIDKIKHLKKLDIQYNFLSDEMIEKLKNLPISEIDLSEQNRYTSNEEDEDFFYEDLYPMLTE